MIHSTFNRIVSSRIPLMPSRVSVQALFPPSSPLIAHRRFSHPELAFTSHHIPLNLKYPSSRLTHSLTHQTRAIIRTCLVQSYPQQEGGVSRPGSKVLVLLSPSDSSLEPLRISIFAARLKKEARHFAISVIIWPAMAREITGWIGEDRE